MKNNYTDQNIFETTSRDIEGLDKRMKDFEKQQLVPTIPAYDAKKFPPSKVSNPFAKPVPGTPPPTEGDYEPNHYPNRATYGQIVRDTNNYDSLWIYQDDDKWHPFGTLARIRFELSYDTPQIYYGGGVGETIVTFNNVYNPYPGVFDVAAEHFSNPDMLIGFIQLGGVYSASYRLFFDFTGGFVDTNMMTQRYEPDWNGWCGYDHYHRSIDNGVWATHIFSVGDDVNDLWPGGNTPYAAWPTGIEQYVTAWQPLEGQFSSDTVKNNLYLGDDGFGSAHPNYFQGSYFEITRLGGADLVDLTKARGDTTSGIYHPPAEEGLSALAVSEAEAKEMFSTLPSQQLKDMDIPVDELPPSVQRRRNLTSPSRSKRESG